jgi:helix-turn-helix protein
MSDIEHGKLERFSLEKLIRLLAHIDCRVTIRVASVAVPRIQPRRRRAHCKAAP